MGSAANSAQTTRTSNYTITAKTEHLDQLRRDAAEEGVTLRRLILGGRLQELEEAAMLPGRVRPRSVTPALASISAEINTALALIAWLKPQHARYREMEAAIRAVRRDLKLLSVKKNPDDAQMARAMAATNIALDQLRQAKDEMDTVMLRLEPVLSTVAGELIAIRQKFEATPAAAAQPTPQAAD